MTIPGPFVTVPNPYRVGSKMHHLFSILQTGLCYPVEDLTHRVYDFPTQDFSLCKRRVASALRTMRRQHNCVDVRYNKANKMYQMIEAFV